MLFTKNLQTLDNQVNQNNQTIEQLELEIAQLREQNIQLEVEKQALLSAKSSAETAIEQVFNAISEMRRSSIPGLEEEFKATIDDIFSRQPDIPQLPAAIIESDHEETSSEVEPALLEFEELEQLTVKKLKFFCNTYLELEIDPRGKKKSDWIQTLLDYRVDVQDLMAALDLYDNGDYSVA